MFLSANLVILVVKMVEKQFQWVVYFWESMVKIKII